MAVQSDTTEQLKTAEVADCSLINMLRVAHPGPRRAEATEATES